MSAIVTGIGIVTSIGIGAENVRNALFAGKDGVGIIERFDNSKFKVSNGYEIKERLPSFRFDATRLVQLAWHAADEALRDSGIEHESNNMCLLVGSGLGDEEFIMQMADKNVSSSEPFLRHRIGPQLARHLNVNGGVISNGTACSASLSLIAYGSDLVRQGEYDTVLVGGSETFTINSMAYFDRVSYGVPRCVKPFDLHREGMLLGEGAGFIVLEHKEKINRSKKRYGEIIGYGLSCDAFHIANMSIDGVSDVMSRAIVDAGISPAEIDYIAAHGTGTPINDEIETRAIKHVYKEHAANTPVSSIKSMIGHTGGASGVIGLISALFAIAEQKLPPTINYENPDPKCDLDYVPNRARECTVNKVQVNSFGFGGANCSVIIRA